LTKEVLPGRVPAALFTFLFD